MIRDIMEQCLIHLWITIFLPPFISCSMVWVQWCIVTLIGLAGMSQVLLLNATDMLTSMIIGSGRKFLERPWPLPLKAGVQGSTESGGMFLRPTQQFRSYSLNERWNKRGYCYSRLQDKRGKLCGWHKFNSSYFRTWLCSDWKNEYFTFFLICNKILFSYLWFKKVLQCFEQNWFDVSLIEQ